MLPVVVAAVAAWVAYLYALTWHAYGSHSDSANAARAGHDLVTGNPLLTGWKLPADSYWSIDLPVFGLLSVVFGLGPMIVHLAPLLIAVCAIGLSAACIHRRGRPSGWALSPGLVALGLLLGLPHAFLVYIFFQGPWHVGTAVLCLAAFMLADAPWRSRRWVGAVALLTAAVVGDPIALAVGVGPVAGASALRALRTRRAQDAVHAVASGAAPVVAAVAVRLLLTLAGAFDVAATETSPLSNVVRNLRHTPRLLGALLGVGPLAGLAGGGQVRAGVLDRVAHLGGAVLLGGAVVASTGGVVVRAVRAARRRRGGADDARADGAGAAAADGEGREDWLDDTLVLGFWASILAAAVVAAPGAGFAAARYLPAPLLFGVTLTGRRLRHLPAAPKPVRLGGAVLLVALLPLYLLGSGRLLSRAEPKDPDAALAGTLLARHLDFGYAPYWIASNTVLHSGGRLTIVPVESVGGRLRPFDFYADSRELHLPPPRQTAALHRSPPRSGPSFVVFRADTGWGNVDVPSARATFGEPAAVETLGPYTLLTWNAPGRDR